MLLLFKRLIDRLMVTLYNIECKFPVKKMEKSKLRLLVVEDEKKLCDMIAKSLHLAGYEVDTCNDGEQALDMIYAEMYDLIVLDLNLPGLDGMEILRELRKENDTRERVAYAEDNPVTLTRKENGILEYLLLNQGRPVSQEELIEHVWDSSVDSFSGSIRVHMSSLRKKLKAGLGYDPIVNKIGEGYKIGGDSRA